VPADMLLRRRLQELDIEVAVLASTTETLSRDSHRPLGAARAMLLVLAAAVVTAAAPDSSRAHAPFEVIGSNKKPVLSVTETPTRQIAVHNDSGKAVIVLASVALSSYVKVLSPATVGKDGKPVPQGNEQALIGQVDGKNPGAWFRTGGPTKNRISIAIADGTPSLDMASGLVNLAHEANGGLLQLGSPDGSEMAAFGVASTGVGIVRTYPLGLPGVNVTASAIFRGSGLPTTFICGLGGCGR
jgi:hypothetical protein